jgi:hypothetical protein
MKKKTAKKCCGIVIIGSGFIGSEAAQSIVTQYLERVDVHLVGKDEVVMQKAIGKPAG